MTIEGQKQCTGWPKSKFTFSICSISETKHFWPHVGKAKMCLRGGGFFQFSKICLHFSAVCLQFFKKNCHISNTFWLYQHGVRNAHRQSYSHLKSEILIWVTLYSELSKETLISSTGKCFPMIMENVKSCEWIKCLVQC